MTDAEIIEALKCCAEMGSKFEKDALDLLNRKDAEIDILIRKKNDAYDENAELKAEIERLKAESQMADGYADALEERVKAEAYKDLAEKLKAKKKRAYFESEGFYWCVSVEDIDEVLKEVSPGESI